MFKHLVPLVRIVLLQVPASSCKSDSLLLLNDLSLIVSRRGLQARAGLGDRYPIELTSSWQKSVELLPGEPINTLDPTLLACDLVGLAPGLVVPGIFGSGLGALAFSVSFFTRLAKFTGETSGWRVEKGSRKYRRPGSSSALRARGLEKGESSWAGVQMKCFGGLEVISWSTKTGWSKSSTRPSKWTILTLLGAVCGLVEEERQLPIDPRIRKLWYD